MPHPSSPNNTPPRVPHQGSPAPRFLSGSKILSLGELTRVRAQAKADGRRVTHCHGCFDIVHPGHIRHLRFAKAQGDVLLVSITGDAGVGKGDGRPLIPQELRAENLAELDCVDWVYVSPEPTAEGLLGSVQPDVYIKGQEYEHNHDPRFEAERRAVEEAGGRVVFSSGDVVFSSTALIEAVESSIDPFHSRLRQLLEDPKLTAPRLTAVIESMRGQRVVIVGEVILDTYVFCDRPDVAGESPVLTLRPLEYRQFDGGAAILARHAAAMGARPILVTALPENERGEELRRRLVAEGIEVRAVSVEMRLPEKQRFCVQTQKVMKVDLVDPIVLDAQQREALIATAQGAAREAQTAAAIVADFGLGLLSPAVLERLIPKLRRSARVLSGDVSGRRSSLSSMRGLDLVCPSESELRDAMGNHGDGLPAVTWKLLEQTSTAAAIVTMGPEGQIAFDRIDQARGPSGPQGAGFTEGTGGWTTRLHSEHVPSLIAHAVDALGCGDALLTIATLALAGGSSLRVASLLGAAAASVQARRIGNIPVSASDLRKEIQRVHGARLAFAPQDVRGAAMEPKHVGSFSIGARA